MNKQEMIPPWKKYPKISRFSIGWRMGEGEYYWMEWGKWYSNLTAEEKEDYMKKYPPPMMWFGFYKNYQ